MILFAQHKKQWGHFFQHHQKMRGGGVCMDKLILDVDVGHVIHAYYISDLF